MDIQLLSASSSPAINVLQQDASLDQMVYNLNASLPLMSRQKVSVKCNSAFTFGKTNDFKLNRFGILTGVVLKLQLANSSGADDTRGPNFGHMMVERATLNSHSREICQLHSQANLASVYEMPLGAKQALLDMAQDDEPTDLTTSPDPVYVPLLFAPMKSGLGGCFDLSFLEEITCSVTLSAKADVFSEAASGVTVDTSNTELICYYLNLNESDLRKYEDMQFSIEKPLSMKSQSTYKESSVTVTPSSTAQQEVTINFNCPNVVTRTLIECHQKGETADTVGNFLPIDKIEYYMSGRLVWSSTGNEEIMENALFYGGSYGVFGASATAVDSSSTQNLYSHWWNVAGDEPNRFSGGVSGKNVSDWSAKVYFTPPTADKNYEINAVHEYINIVSISGASGKVAVSLSL